MAYWTYQTNPQRIFQMEEMLKFYLNHTELKGKDIAFQPRDGEENGIGIGDLVYLCETAAKGNPGVLGTARVTTHPKEIEMPAWQEKFWIGKESDRNPKYKHRVGMEILRVFNERISRSALQGNLKLKSLDFASNHGYQGTMRRMTEEQAFELDHLADR